MGISPTDKSQEFIKSGMTLITQIDSEKYMKKIQKKNVDKKEPKS
jgi:hypothetical protein